MREKTRNCATVKFIIIIVVIFLVYFVAACHCVIRLFVVLLIHLI